MRLRDVVLGLIQLHPGVTGYELRAIIRQSTGYFFSASLSQIYPALKELTAAGHVTIEVAQTTGRQDRKMYTITDAGRAALTAILSAVEPLPYSMAAFQLFLLHVTFLGHVQESAARHYLTAQLEHFREQRQTMVDSKLDVERAYLHLGGQERARYLRLWEAEYAFLLREADTRIAWIEDLLAQEPLPAPGE